jgi:heptosyltransferase-2
VKSPQKILVFRKSSLGDVILTLPVIEALMNHLPQAGIDYFTKTPYAPLVEHHPGVDNVISFDDNRSFREVLRKISSGGYDLFVDLQSNFQSWFVALNLRGTRRVRYGRRRLAREMIVRRPQMKFRVDHTINAYLRTLRRIGISVAPSPPVLGMPDTAVEFAESFLEENIPDGCTKLVAVCPGARYPEKRWPYQNFRGVCEKLLEDESVALLVISSQEDEVPRNLGPDHPRVTVVRDLEILRLAALLRRCRVALTNDSGIMHLSCAVGTPVVAIFGPTNPRLGFAPALPGSKVICDDVFCSPCSLHGQRSCRQKVKYCFEDVTVERVKAELDEML